MYSGTITRTSPNVDVVETLTGLWNEYDSGDWHIVVTPFFTTVTGNLSAGSHVLPFKMASVVAATVCHGDGSVSAVIIRPGENVVSLSKAGLFSLQVFGRMAQTRK